MAWLRSAALAAWRLICALAIYLFIWLRLYQLKSKLHRCIYDSQWKNKIIPTFQSTSDLLAYMDRFVWRKDGWAELFDAVCTPEKVQATLEARDPGVAGKHHGNDCDEMGIWQVATIKKSVSEGSLNGIKNAYLFTVMWVETDTFLSQGHNLTLIEFDNGDFGAMDYGWTQLVGLPIDEIAKGIRLKYAGWNTTGHGKSPSLSLAWAIQSLDLKPIKIRFKGP